MDDYVRTYERLCDYRSKMTLYSIIANWYRYDFGLCSKTVEHMFDDYFDHDILKCGKDEVIADVGAYTGDTVLSYVKNYGPDCYKRIYCYEITPEAFSSLKENTKHLRDIVLRNKGVSNAYGMMRVNFSSGGMSANTMEEGETGDIETVTLDGDISEPLTIIKTDAEGADRKIIEGAKGHIANDRPKLLVSVYHDNDDLWLIPDMIDSYAKGYSYYLRYKSSPIYPTEITLFAIP